MFETHLCATVIVKSWQTYICGLNFKHFLVWIHDRLFLNVRASPCFTNNLKKQDEQRSQQCSSFIHLMH